MLFLYPFNCKKEVLHAAKFIWCERKGQIVKRKKIK
jgi:hypothetical protein